MSSSTHSHLSTKVLSTCIVPEASAPGVFLRATSVSHRPLLLVYSERSFTLNSGPCHQACTGSASPDTINFRPIANKVSFF